MSHPPKTPPVWESFEPAVKDGKVISVTCIHCYKVYKYFGNTNNLRRHLKMMHPDIETVTSGAVDSCQPPKRKINRNRTSLVWEFFTQTIENGEVVMVTCKHCNKSFKHYKNTTNLHNHLRKYHCDEKMKNKNKKTHPEIPSTVVWESFWKIYVNNKVRVVCKHCYTNFEQHNRTSLLDHLERKHPNVLLEIQKQCNNTPVETVTILTNESLIPDQQINEPFETITFYPDESSQTETQFNAMEYFETITVFPEDSSNIREQTNEINETVTILAEGPSNLQTQTDESLGAVTILAEQSLNLQEETDEINRALETFTILARGPWNLQEQTDESLETFTILASGPSNLQIQTDEMNESLKAVPILTEELSNLQKQSDETNECLETATILTEEPSNFGEHENGTDESFKTVTVPTEGALNLEENGSEVGSETLETITVYVDESSEAGGDVEMDYFDISNTHTEKSLDNETQLNESDDSSDTITSFTKKSLKTKRYKSIVWSSFDDIIRNGKKLSTVCKHCNKRYQYFGCTTNLYAHLRRMHPDQLRNQEGMASRSKNNVTKIVQAKAGSKESIAWKYFKKTKRGKIVQLRCNECNKLFKYLGNTSNLIQHLRSIHSIHTIKRLNQKNITSNTDEHLKPPPNTAETVVSQPESKEREVEISDNNNHSTKQSPSLDLIRNPKPTNDEIRKFEKDLIHMIAVDSQPLSLVENPGFRSFIGQYIPRYNLPSQKTLSEKVLPEVYRSLRDNCKTILEQCKYISITTGRWRSNSNKTYVTVSAHYIYEFKTLNLVLSTVEAKNNVTEKIIDVLNEWGITEKIVSVVTDNAASMEEVVSNLGQHYIPCIIHVLNSSVQEAIKQTKRLEGLLSKFLTTNFKEDDLGANILKQFQRVQGLPVRCNFRFITESLSKIQESSNKPIDLEKYESDTIDDFIQIFTILSLVIEDLSNEKYPTISRTVMLIKGLQSELKKKDLATEVGKQLKLSVVIIVSRRLAFLESSQPVAKAIFLDPRFKLAAFTSQQAANTAQKSVIDELSKLIKYSETPTPWPSNSTSNDNEIRNHENISAISSTVAPEASAELIIQRYLEMPYLDRKKDPLEFWKTHVNTFPKLYSLASKYLSIPGTSVPTDLIFSKDGIIDDKRSRLPSKGLNELLFISENVKSINQKTDL